MHHLLGLRNMVKPESSVPSHPIHGQANDDSTECTTYSYLVTNLRQSYPALDDLAHARRLQPLRSRCPPPPVGMVSCPGEA